MLFLDIISNIKQIGHIQLKKIILFSLLISSLYSDAKIYLGTSVGMHNETFSNISLNTSSPMASLKIGYGIRESYAVEFSLDYIQKDKDIYSVNDGNKIALNVDLIKAFDFGIYINPYFKAGFGSGAFATDEQAKSTMHYGGFNLGFGTFIPINEHLDFDIGYSYRNTNYEKMTSSSISYASNINVAYVGVNVRF